MMAAQNSEMSSQNSEDTLPRTASLSPGNLAILEGEMSANHRAMRADAVTDEAFLVKSDFIRSCASTLLGLIVFGAAAACFMAALKKWLLFCDADINGGQLNQDIGTLKIEFSAFCGVALLLLLLALALFLQFGTPTVLYISQIKGVWSLSLHRRGRMPIVRRLEDLDAFLETFGRSKCFNLSLPCRMRSVGYSTSTSGTVRLFFVQSFVGREMAMSCSLQEPRAFFTMLRDVMSATKHGLAATTAEYVADWEGESFSSEP